MTAIPHRRLILRWTTPKNLLTILAFVAIGAGIEGILVTYSIPTPLVDPTAINIPTVNAKISLLYHFLPATVVIALTASFTHLAAQTAIMRLKPQPAKKPPESQKPTRLKYLRQLFRRLQRTSRKIKNRILRTPTVASLQRRISLARAIITSAATITATFIILIILVTLAAYPQIVPTLTANFYRTNTFFLNFVAATIEASKTVANTITPLGILATTIQNGLNSAAPGFRAALEGAASSITKGLVSLEPTEKYLIIQNAAAWSTAGVTLLYSQYAKTHRYRR